MAAPTAAETPVAVNAESIVVPDPTQWMNRNFSRATAPQLVSASPSERVDASKTVGPINATGLGRRNPFNNS